MCAFHAFVSGVVFILACLWVFVDLAGACKTKSDCVSMSASNCFMLNGNSVLYYINTLIIVHIMSCDRSAGEAAGAYRRDSLPGIQVCGGQLRVQRQGQENLQGPC